MSLFRTLASALGRRPGPAAVTAPPAPDRPFCAIGDIHGCEGLLKRLVARLEAEAPGAAIVCVGDYVDRGENAREVLAYLHDRNRADPRHFVCLLGNHEQMLLRFLDNPEDRARGWFANGGLQTVASYRTGISLEAGPVAIRDALAHAMGEDLIAWLRGLPRYWSTGNMAVVHAGADPGLPLDRQGERTLLWGHRDFATVPRCDGLWVVHGHTIVPEPRTEAGRVAIDTGAYATGRLTAALVTAGKVRFLST